MNKANWKVQDHTFLTHIRHDIKKGVDNTTWNWQNISISYAKGFGLKLFQNGVFAGSYGVDALGCEDRHSEDNTIFNNINLTRLATTATMTQELTKTANNGKTEKSENKMSVSTNEKANELASLAKTVGAQFQTAGVTALKTKTGEALLKAVENVLLENTGFAGKVKFKFMPELLDLGTAALVSVIVAEYLPENVAGAMAAESLRLAAMRRVTDRLPITDIIDKITKSGTILENLSSK